MPRVNIIVPPNQNISKESLETASEEIFDGFIDEAQAFRKRPGYALFCDLGNESPIDGLYYWEERGVILAVSAQKLYSITSAGVATLVGATTPFLIGSRATFAACKPGGVQKIIITNGQVMQQYDGTTLTPITDGDAPALVSHVAFIDQYIIANSLTAADASKFFFSNVNDPTAWTAADFSDVEARPDDLTALDVGWREIIAAGPRSIEFYVNDGTTPFSRLDGAAVNGGIGARFSLKFFNNTWTYLDAQRRFVRLEGRTPQIISKPIDRTIQGLSVVSDAISDVLEVDGRHFYVTTFPTDNKTFVYDFQGDYWSQWGNWNPTFQQYDRFGGNASCYDRSTNKWLIGHKSNGKIYTMGLGTYLDGSDPIRTSIKTGFIDFGTSKRKKSNCLSFNVNCGDGKDGGNAASAFAVQYRDSNAGQFGNARLVGMGTRGNSYFYRELRRNGMYRSRQYEIVHADNSAFNLVRAEEEVELLAT